MKKWIILLILISPFLSRYNLTFLNHKDFKFKEKSFGWTMKIEDLPGQIYLEDSNFFFPIQDIPHYKEGKYIMTYNGESGYNPIPYHIHVGLLDLGKIIKHK